ncbi:aromatic amino acid aminotransferase 1 [Hortaea werneckii]|nr:aromatic amino acid aminotransferase 1 [Hortaea werneckii]KAI7344927.1 aromatic amino acid aminotransferase 1 [Hortaea werneckii]
MTPPPPAAIQVLPESDTSTFTVPDRLTLQNLAKRRAASGKLVAGIAAPADIEQFKGRTQHLHKPKAKRWDERISAEAKGRKGSSLKNAAKFLKTPGLISLGGGLPSAEYFPIEEFGFKAASSAHLESRDAIRDHATQVVAGKHDMAEGTSDFDIATALQYGQGHGAAQLLRWMVEHTELVHDPPYQDWSCTMTVGSTSAFDMALRMFAKPGDWVLSEEFTFPAAQETAAPMGVRFAAVGMDENGMRADALDEVLSNWDEKARGGPKPFLVYTVPTGQNPTGATQPLERRREVYKIAQKHDLYILEDEPYYFLQMQPYAGPDAPATTPPATHEDFLKSLVPSFLSLDTDGRVMRMDSFSKVIAPGSRCGWITASEQICKLYSTHADLSTQGPSGPAQLMLFKLLEEHFGHAGYLDWLLHIRMEYTKRRDVILAACETYLPKDLVRWEAPTAGMFHWMQVDHTKHPQYPSSKSVEEIEEEIFLKNVEFKTLLMKGSWFRAEQDQELQAMFFRATYAAAPFEQIEEAIQRFGRAVRDVFGVGGQANGHAR